MAPGVGLYLDELFYDGYNNKVQFHEEQDAKAREKYKKPLPEVNDDDDGQQVSSRISMEVRRDIIVGTVECT